MRETWHDMQSAVYGIAIFMYTKYYAKLIIGEDPLTPFLKVRKVSQDPLENAFSNVRGGLGANTAPTTVDVCRYFANSEQVDKYIGHAHKVGVNSAQGKAPKRAHMKYNSPILESETVRKNKRNAIEMATLDDVPSADVDMGVDTHAASASATVRSSRPR